MKNTIKLLGIIALSAVIGFGLAACGDDNGGGYEEKMLTISGTFGGATVGGDSRPVKIITKFEWDELEVELDDNGSTWSLEHYSFKNAQPLWFDVNIFAEGVNENDEARKTITYQYDIKYQIKDSNITGISLPAIVIEDTIKLSGTVDITLDGDYEDNYWRKIQVVKTTDVNDNPNSSTNLSLGWKAAICFVEEDGTWEVIIPSSNTDIEIYFCVQMGYSEKASVEYPYGLWEVGKINRLNYIDVSDTDVTDIDLGVQNFIVLSGNTNAVLKNGERPVLYRFEFGNWNSDGNRWTGTTRFLYTGSAWKVPMPANIQLIPQITYYETDRRQFRVNKNIGDVFDTGNEAKTLNLGSLSL